MKKILFISARLPYPMIEGHQIRTFGVLSQLAKQYDVHLFSLLREGEQIPTDNRLSQICSSISGFKLVLGIFNNIRAIIQSFIYSKPLMITRYISNNLKRDVQKKIQELQPDIIHFDLLTLAGLFEIIPSNIPVVLNEHNIESDLIKQKAAGHPSGLMKIILQREAKLLAKFERNACVQATAVLACSDNDCNEFKRWDVKNVYTIPNGVDTNALLPEYQDQNNHFVFLGGMGWYPNKQGMEWFIKEVMPLLYAVEPAIQIDVIGNPEPYIFIPEKFKNNINILGFVDDFKPLVRQARAMIVPLTVGSGTRLKVLEGMSLGKCIISTEKGSEGILLEDKKDIIFANTASAFSSEILSLLNDHGRAINIGKQARKLAVNTYDWNIIGENINNIYQELY